MNVFFSLLILNAMCSFFLFSEPLKVNVIADAAILINADTGAILYEKNARVQHYPASITKIATAFYTLKKKGNSLDELITAEKDAVATVTPEARRKANYSLTPYWLEVGGSHVGIKVGERLSLQDLLYGMMIQSGNDAANVIAQYAGNGSIAQFMEELNQCVKAIGCKDTRFLNPHGLYHPDHKTTPYDMALLTIEAMKDPVFRKIVSTERYTRPKTNKQEATTFVQTNKLLRSGPLRYPKAIGVKTGYTALAQHNLVAAAKQDDRVLIAVLMHVKERSDMFKDAIKLFDAAFNQEKVQRTLFQAGPQKAIRSVEGASNPIATMLSEQIVVEYYPAEEPKFKAQVIWLPIEPPIEKNQAVGELLITTQEGKVIQKAKLLSQAYTDATWSYKMQQFMGNIQRNNGLLWFGSIVALAVIGGLIFINYKRS